MILIVTLSIVAAVVLYKQIAHTQSQLSIKPPVKFSNISLSAIDSTLGVNAKIPYSTIQQAAELATDTPQNGQGERRTCKRIIGAKVCATLQWQYLIQRTGPVRLNGNAGAVRVSIPLSIQGKVGIDGHGGKLLGLRDKDINGDLELIADLKVSIGPDWCPVIKSRISYQWLSDPQIRLLGKVKINIRKSANKALNKKLQKLEQKFSTIIDCEKFRQQLAKNWKVHNIPIKVPGQGPAYLQLIPKSAAVTNILSHSDHVSIALEMQATTQVTETRSTDMLLALPELSSAVTDPGSIEFSLLIKVPYPRIKEIVSGKVLGSIQQSDGKTFQILSFDLYPSGNRLIFDLGFRATGFKAFLETTGNLYLSARPVADPDSNELHFEDLQYTRIIDSELWSLFSTVIHRNILDSLNRASVIDMAPQMAKLEKSIVTTLSDPDKTSGILVNAQTPKVRLVNINPEKESLAAIIHVSTRLEATIPPGAILRD